MHVVLLGVDYELRSFPFASEQAPCLLPVANLTLLDRTIRWLRARGLGTIHLITERDPIEDFEVTRAIVQHDLRVEPSISCALDRARRCGKLDQPMLVLQANLHPLPDLGAIVAQHVAGVHALTFVRGTCRFGPGRYSYGPPVLAVGAPVFSRLLLRNHLDRPLASLPRLGRSRGLLVEAVDPSVQTVEINNPFALHQANLDALLGPVSDFRAVGLDRIREKLWALPGADIGRVDVDPRGGPIVVAHGAVIEDGALLRGPMVIGAGVHIERRSCLHRAVVLDGTWLPPESFVANSIVSPRLTQRIAC